MTMPDTRASTTRQEVVAAGIDEKIRAQYPDTARKFSLIDAHFASINTRFDSFDKRFDEFTESLKLLQDRVPAHDSYGSMPKNSSQSPAGSVVTRTNHGVMRLAEIVLPRFSGDKLEDWLFRVERFFEIHRPPDIDKINMAAMLMQDKAAQWHQSVQDSEYGSAIIKSWTAYRELLIDRFKEDPFEKMRAMFQRWREEDIIEKQKRKAELSPIQKYVAAKQSIKAKDSLLLLRDTGQNTPLGDKATTEIVAHEVNDPASASDPLDLWTVAIEGSSDVPLPDMVFVDDSSLDSRTGVIQHQSITDSTLDSSSDELLQETLLLDKFSFATNLTMVKDSRVSQVSLSTLEPCLQMSVVSVGVGDVRQMELGLDDFCARSFKSLQISSTEVWSDFFHESANVRALELIPGAAKCVVLDSQQATATNETRPALMAANWHQVEGHFASENSGFSCCAKFLEKMGFNTKFLELLSHYVTVLKLNVRSHNAVHRLSLLEPNGRALAEFVFGCESIRFPLGCAINYWFLTTMPSSSAHSPVVKRVIQVWDPGRADADMLGTKAREFDTFSWSDKAYTESLNGAISGEVSVLTEVLSQEAFTTWCFLFNHEDMVV